jgi:hypothetical protein
LRDIGDARVQIEDLLSGAPDESIAADLSRPPRFRQRALPWAVAAGVLAVALVLVWMPWRKTLPPPLPLRLSSELGADASLANAGYGPVAILSADGAVVAFVAQKGAGPQLYVRRLTQPQARALSGTDDAQTGWDGLTRFVHACS